MGVQCPGGAPGLPSPPPGGAACASRAQAGRAVRELADGSEWLFGRRGTGRGPGRARQETAPGGLLFNRFSIRFQYFNRGGAGPCYPSGTHNYT